MPQISFNKDWKLILIFFFSWRFLLFLVAFIASLFIKFGGSFPYYDQLLIPTGMPEWVWSFANFDGVHYIRLAKFGYEGSNFSQAFFPLFPIIIKFISLNMYELIFGLAVVNIFFILGIFFYYLLLRIDFDRKITLYSIIFLLIYPTSFYFGALYNESLLFLLSVSAILAARKQQFLVAALLIALASATKIFGLTLMIILFYEIVKYLKTQKIKMCSERYIICILSLCIAPLGFIVYSYYLQKAFGDPILFLSAQPHFGAERSATPLIFLPQVLFRYAKMLLVNTPFNYQFITLISELFFTIIPLTCLLFLWKRIRIDYALFTLVCLLLPTLTGTLSSMPRYSLMGFLLIPYLVNLLNKKFYWLVFIFIFIQIIFVILFTRGYWVA